MCSIIDRRENRRPEGRLQPLASAGANPRRDASNAMARERAPHARFPRSSRGGGLVRERGWRPGLADPRSAAHAMSPTYAGRQGGESGEPVGLAIERLALRPTMPLAELATEPGVRPRVAYRGQSWRSSQIGQSGAGDDGHEGSTGSGAPVRCPDTYFVSSNMETRRLPAKALLRRASALIMRLSFWS